MNNEALRLAEEGMRMHTPNSPEYIISKELRRLHEMNQDLVEALELMTERFLDVDGNHGTYEQEAICKAYEALSKATGESNA